MTGIIIINKPSDWTSHDVVAKLRGILHERRIGHGGTLDPMARGVLPVFVGRATRAVEFIENADKEYICGLRLGTVTDTQDITGTVLSETEANVPKDELLKLLTGFTGEQTQIPPMYSAIKVNGKKLYQLARKGVAVERQPREITIHELELLDWNGSEGSLRVVCSKGTYIRTLCHDIGERLGCGGVMTSLVRTRVGVYRIEDAAELSDAAPDRLLPVDSVFGDLPDCTVGESQLKKCMNGAEFALEVPDGRYRVYGEDGSFLMLGEAKNGIMRTVKSFFEVS